MGILRFCNKIFHNVLQRRALQAHFLCFQWSRNQQIFCFSESCTCSLFLPLCTLCILHSGNLYQYWFIYSYKPRYLSPIYRNRKKKRKQMMQPMTARAILPQVQGRWTVSSWFPHFEHLGFFDKALAISILYFLRILVMELFEGFHPEWEKCTWKKAADTCEKPGNQYCKYEYKCSANANMQVQILMKVQTQGFVPDCKDSKYKYRRKTITNTICFKEIHLQKEQLLIHKGRSTKGWNHSMPKVEVEEVTTVQTVSPQGPQGRAWWKEKTTVTKSQINARFTRESLVKGLYETENDEERSLIE